MEVAARGPLTAAAAVGGHIERRLLPHRDQQQLAPDDVRRRPPIRGAVEARPQDQSGSVWPQAGLPKRRPVRRPAVGPGLRGERRGPDEPAGGPVEHIGEGVPVGLHHERPARDPTGAIGREYRHLGGIPIELVVLGELIPPAYPPGGSFDGEEGIGRQVGAGPPQSGEVRIGLSYSPEEETGRGVIGARHPRAAATRLGPAPGGSVGVPASGHGGEAPAYLPRRRDYRDQRPARSLVTTTHADDECVADRKRGTRGLGQPLAVVQIHDPAAPSRRRVQSDQAAVVRTVRYDVAGEARSAIGPRAAGLVPSRRLDVLPSNPTGAELDRIRAA